MVTYEEDDQTLHEKLKAAEKLSTERQTTWRQIGLPIETIRPTEIASRFGRQRSNCMRQRKFVSASTIKVIGSNDAKIDRR